MSDDDSKKRARDLEWELRISSIETVFQTLPYEKQRKLLIDLTKVAALPPNQPFLKWLHAGNKKFFTDKEITHAWEMWSFICKNALSAWDDGEYGNRLFSINPFWHHDETGNIIVDWFEYHGGYLHMPSKTLPRERYFEWIFENTIPEEVSIYPADLSSDIGAIHCDKFEDMTIEGLRLMGWRDL